VRSSIHAAWTTPPAPWASAGRHCATPGRRRARRARRAREAPAAVARGGDVGARAARGAVDPGERHPPAVAERPTATTRRARPRAARRAARAGSRSARRPWCAEHDWSRPHGAPRRPGRPRRPRSATVALRCAARERGGRQRAREARPRRAAAREGRRRGRAGHRHVAPHDALDVPVLARPGRVGSAHGTPEPGRERASRRGQAARAAAARPRRAARPGRPRATRTDPAVVGLADHVPARVPRGPRLDRDELLVVGGEAEDVARELRA
jgi:hypothetical protein